MLSKSRLWKSLTYHAGALVFGYSGYQFIHSGDALGAFFAGATVAICLNAIREMDQEYCDCPSAEKKTDEAEGK